MRRSLIQDNGFWPSIRWLDFLPKFRINQPLRCYASLQYLMSRMADFVGNRVLGSFIDFVFKNTWLVLLKAVHTIGEIFRRLRVKVAVLKSLGFTRKWWCSYNAKHCWKHSLREQARETGKLILDRCIIAIQLENPGHTGTSCLVTNKFASGV
jgi:hypothetical protein